MAEGELIRRAEAMRLLGLTAWRWHKLVETGTVKPIYLYPGAHALFKRSDVETLKEAKNG